MVVIADTSPLNYLILIETVDVLPKLYQRLLIPDVVLRELQHSDTPRHSTELVIDSRLAELDAGESVAIALAEAHRPNALLLMDDFKGRDEAERRQIPTVGTLGIFARRGGARIYGSAGGLCPPSSNHVPRATRTDGGPVGEKSIAVNRFWSSLRSASRYTGHSCEFALRRRRRAICTSAVPAPSYSTGCTPGGMAEL